MDVQQNTLYVMTQGAYLRQDHQTIRVEVDRQARLVVPLHHIDSVAMFGRVSSSPDLLRACADAGVCVTYLTENGRLLARVDAPSGGNVLLRREQFRWADRPASAVAVARCSVAGKLQNCRNLLLRAARQSEQPEEAKRLDLASQTLEIALRSLPAAATTDEVRGHEGAGAAAYFDVFTLMIRQQRQSFEMTSRSRRPPLDRVNALLSFAYSMLLHDCVAALAACGLDPNVGFLHTDRPGRPSLALDLMEEFRPLLADRLVLALINRRQVQPDDFVQHTGGGIELKAEARKAVVAAYQAQKQEQVRHPLLDCTNQFRVMPFLQARLLARTIRGEIEHYPPLVLK